MVTAEDNILNAEAKWNYLQILVFLPKVIKIDTFYSKYKMNNFSL